MNWTDEPRRTSQETLGGGIEREPDRHSTRGGKPQCRDRQGPPAQAVGPRTHLFRLLPRPKKTASSNGPRPAARTSRQVTTTVGATALQARYDSEPDAHAQVRPQAECRYPDPAQAEAGGTGRAHLQMADRAIRCTRIFAFCGNDVGECGPYCGYHSKLAYQPASEPP